MVACWICFLVKISYLYLNSMTQFLSDKLRVLSLISILFVLYIHSGFHSNEIEGMIWNYRCQEFISGMLGRCAVPLFYVISGYLFFLKVSDGMKSIYAKIQKRMRTLLVPYIVGCLFFVLFGVIIAITPGISKYVNGSVMPLFNEPLHQIICSIFYDSGSGTPCAFQLWFLRDLILIVATSPIWYLLLKHLRWIFVITSFGLTYIQLPFVPFFALFWFLLGGQLVQVKNGYGGASLTMLSIVTFLLLSIVQLFMPDMIGWELVNIPIIILGLISVWGIYDMVLGKDFKLSEHRWLATACQFTFFIYLFHEPTLNIVRKLIIVVLGKNEYGYLISYLISPWIFIICFVIIGLQFRKYLPKVYHVCTGGR